MHRNETLSSGVAAVLLLAPLAAVGSEEKIVSGVLEGFRPNALVCDVTNKSGDTRDDVVLTLKTPDGSTLGNPVECDGLPDGASCNLTYEIGFSDGIVAAYCHAHVPSGYFFRGSFRLIDSYSNTLAVSDLVGDIHGKLDGMSGLACRVVKQQAASPLFPGEGGTERTQILACQQDEVAMSGGYVFADPRWSLRQSRNDNEDTNTWRYTVNREGGSSSGNMQFWGICCIGSAESAS